MMRLITLATCLLAAIGCAPATAQTTFLAPGSWRMSTPGTASVQLVTRADIGNLVPRPFSELSSFIITDTIGSRDSSSRLAGDITSMEIPVRASGTTVLTATAKPTTQSVPAAQFNNFLDYCGFSKLLADRKNSGNDKRDVIFTISASYRSNIQIGSSPTPNFFAPVGGPLELIPTNNPFSLPTPNSVPLDIRLLRNRQPADEVCIEATEMFGANQFGPSSNMKLRPKVASFAMFGGGGQGGLLVRGIALEPSVDGVRFTAHFAMLVVRLGDGVRI